MPAHGEAHQAVCLRGGAWCAPGQQRCGGACGLWWSAAKSAAAPARNRAPTARWWPPSSALGRPGTGPSIGLPPVARFPSTLNCYRRSCAWSRPAPRSGPTPCGDGPSPGLGSDPDGRSPAAPLRHLSRRGVLHPDRAAAPAPPVAAGDEPVQGRVGHLTPSGCQQLSNAGELQALDVEPPVDLVRPGAQRFLAGPLRLPRAGTAGAGPPAELVLGGGPGPLGPRRPPWPPPGTSGPCPGTGQSPMLSCAGCSQPASAVRLLLFPI